MAKFEWLKMTLSKIFHLKKLKFMPMIQFSAAPIQLIKQTVNTFRVFQQQKIVSRVRACVGQKLLRKRYKNNDDLRIET